MQRYPCVLYHAETLERVRVESAFEEHRLRQTGHFVSSPAEVGVVTAPAVHQWDGRTEALRATWLQGALTSVEERGQQMFQALWAAPLTGASVEELVWVEAQLQLLEASLKARDLEISDALVKRKRQIDRQLQLRLMEELELEEEALAKERTPEQKRAQHLAKVKKLSQVVYGKLVEGPPTPEP